MAGRFPARSSPTPGFPYTVRGWQRQKAIWSGRTLAGPIFATYLNHPPRVSPATARTTLACPLRSSHPSTDNPGQVWHPGKEHVPGTRVFQHRPGHQSRVTSLPHWESAKLSLGFQFFNVLNHPNFDQPISQPGRPAVRTDYQHRQPTDQHLRVVPGRRCFTPAHSSAGFTHVLKDKTAGVVCHSQYIVRRATAFCRLRARPRRRAHMQGTAADTLIEQVFPPALVRSAQHAHDVAAGVKGKGPRLSGAVAGPLLPAGGHP